MQRPQMFEKIKIRIRKLTGTLVVCSFLLPAPAVMAQQSVPIAILQGVTQNLGNLSQMMLSQRRQALNLRIQQSLNGQANALFNEPNQFFPECQLMRGNFDRPQNMCKRPSEGIPISQQDVALAQRWETHALLIQEGVRVMREEGRIRNLPVGLQCIKDRRRSLENQIDAQIREIERLQARVNTEFDSAALTNEAQALFDDVEMESAMIEGLDKDQRLAGPDGIPATNKPSKDFPRIDSYFAGSACQSVIPLDKFEPNQNFTGLRGVRDFSREQSTSSQITTYQSEASAWKKDLNNQIKYWAERSQKLGLKEFLDNDVPFTNASRQYDFDASVKVVLASSKKELTDLESTLRADLSGAGIRLPSTKDHRYDKTMSDILSGGIPAIEERWIKECAFSRISTEDGVKMPGVSIDEIVNSTYVQLQGSAVATFRQEVKRILEDDSTLNSKKTRLQALEKTYGIDNLGVNLNRSVNGTQVDRIRVSGLVSLLENNCRAYFRAPGSANFSESLSPYARAERAIQSVNRIKKANNDFRSEFLTKVQKRIINCEGIPAPQAPGSCQVRNGAFQRTSSQFCFAHADTCSQNIQNCSVKTQEVLNQKIEARRVKAKRYNDFIKDKLNRQSAILNPLAESVNVLTESLVRRFQGENFGLDELKMGIAIMPGQPSQSDSKLGVALLGAETFGRPGKFKDYLLQLPQKLETLSNHLKKAKENINRAIEVNIAELEQRYNQLDGFWPDLANQCSRITDLYNRQVAEQNKANLAAYQQQMDARNEAVVNHGKFCKLLTSYESTPGCGKPLEDLYEASTVANNYISDSKLYDIEAYTAICASANNEKEKGDSSDGFDLTAECDEAGRRGISGKTIFKQSFQGLGQKAHQIAQIYNLNPEDVRNFFVGDKMSLETKNIYPRISSYFDDLAKLKSNENVCEGHHNKFSDEKIKAKAEKMCKSKSAKISEDAQTSRNNYQSLTKLSDKLTNLASNLHLGETQQMMALGYINSELKLLRDPNFEPSPASSIDSKITLDYISNSLGKLIEKVEKETEKALANCADLQAEDPNMDLGGDTPEFRATLALVGSLKKYEEKMFDEITNATLGTVATHFHGEVGFENCAAQAGDQFINDMFQGFNNGMRGPAGLPTDSF